MAEAIQENEKERTTRTREIKRVPKQTKITDNTLIKVKSAVFGKLIFVNKRNGNKIVWNSQGEVKYLTFGELVEIRNQSISFYKNQRILVLGMAEEEECDATVEDVYNALGVKEYYKNLVDPTDYRAICGWSVQEIPERVKMLSQKVKENLVVALNQFIKDGVLDSRKKIQSFKTALGCEFEDDI